MRTEGECNRVMVVSYQRCWNHRMLLLVIVIFLLSFFECDRSTCLFIPWTFLLWVHIATCVITSIRQRVSNPISSLSTFTLISHPHKLQETACCVKFYLCTLPRTLISSFHATTNEKPHNFYASPYIFSVIESMNMRWAKHVAHMLEVKCLRNFCWKDWR
jgi:hypothetical protein